MRFDALAKHRNFKAVAQMLHKKATPDIMSRVASFYLSKPFSYTREG